MIMKRTALISGGTSGLGLQVVKDLTNIGYKVYSISRKQERINQLREELSDVTFFCGEISDIKVLNKAFDVISKENNELNVLVNNAGIIYPGGVEELEVDKWNKMFEVNVNGIFSAVKVFLPLLKKAGNASIVNISSISSSMTGSSIAYSACKAAVDMMTKSMAKELALYSIRVNSVNPGIISTGFQVHNDLMDENKYLEFLNSVSETYPLGIGDAKDISNLVMFLISEQAKWITGSNYIIDGGSSVNI